MKLGFFEVAREIQGDARGRAPIEIGVQSFYNLEDGGAGLVAFASKSCISRGQREPKRSVRRVYRGGASQHAANDRTDAYVESSSNR